MRLKNNIALSESGFVFDPSTGDSFSLNEQAREILRLINSEKSQEEITEVMLAEYDIERPEFEKYYFDFIGMLRQFKLIEDDE